MLQEMVDVILQHAFNQRKAAEKLKNTELLSLH